jgi:hypothetical protein
MATHTIHIEIDDEEVYRAFLQWKRDGKYRTQKLAFYNFTEIRQRIGLGYMVVKHETRGRPRGRKPKYMPASYLSR